MHHRLRKSFLLSTFIGVLCFLCSCNASTVVITPDKHTPGATASSAPAATPTPIPVMQTSCPTAGTARVAIMPPISTPSTNHAAIIYAYNSNNSAALKKYDVVTDSKTTILTYTSANLQSEIDAARLSADGQWVILKDQVDGKSAIQLVRVDGQALQTLYCYDGFSLRGLSWSPNQRYLAFSQTPAQAPASQGPNLFIMDLTTGKLQVDIKLPNVSAGYEPVQWLDNTGLYLTYELVGVGGDIRNRSDLYLLHDVTSDASQQSTNLQKLTFPQNDPGVSGGACQDFAISPDHTQLLTSDCTIRMGNNDPTDVNEAGPATLKLQSLASGAARTLHSDATHAITYARFVSNSTIIFIISNIAHGNATATADISQNGLWKINTDGSGLTRLSTAPTNTILNFELLNYTPWSIVSRDGKQFALQSVANPLPNSTTAVITGSLAGGPTKTLASAPNMGDNTLTVVGWTSL